MNHKLEQAISVGRLPLSVTLCFFLSGCSYFSYQAQSEKAIGEYQEFESWTPQTDAVAGKAHLVDLIEIPALEAPLRRAVQQALEANPGLQQTLLAWSMAHQEITVSNADRLPELSMSTSARHNDNRGSSSTDSLNINFNVSWEMDLWGRLKDQVTAAENDALEAELTYQAASDALAGEVIQTWLELISQQQQYRYELERTEALERLQQVIAKRYRLGLSTLSDLDTARSEALSSRATAESYAQDAMDLRRQLNQILGGRSDVLPDVSETLPEIVEPLADIPERSLANRPDLKAAYAKIQAEEARTRVAYKDLLPTLELSLSMNFSSSSSGGGGSGGSYYSNDGSSSGSYNSNYSNNNNSSYNSGSYGSGSSSASNSLFSSPSWSLLGNLSAPIFNGGRLLAEAEISELTAEQAYWEFRETLLTAVYEIDNAIGTENSLGQRLILLNKALESAERSALRYRARYQSGLVDILDLIDTQTQVYDLKIQIVQLRYEQLSNRVGLGLALGLGA